MEPSQQQRDGCCPCEGPRRSSPAQAPLPLRSLPPATSSLQLLALDSGNKKQLAPREKVAQLETVCVPAAGRGAAAAARAGRASGGASSGSSSPPPGMETCAICLEEPRAGDRLRRLPCRHCFHAKCIDRWLTQERNACPICQQPI